MTYPISPERRVPVTRGASIALRPFGPSMWFLKVGLVGCAPRRAASAATAIKGYPDQSIDKEHDFNLAHLIGAALLFGAIRPSLRAASRLFRKARLTSKHSGISRVPWLGWLRERSSRRARLRVRPRCFIAFSRATRSTNPIPPARSCGIWRNLFGGSKKNSEENSEE